MGFFNRLGKIAAGVGGAVHQVAGLVGDLATAPWNSDEQFNGFWHTIVARTETRGGALLGDVVGPQRGLGAVIGAIPEPIRQPARDVINPVMSASNTLYTDAISRPITTAITAGSLASSDTYGGSSGWSPVDVGQAAGKLLDPGTWRDAYNISDHRSPGQAFALAVKTDDILDPQEVQAAQHSDFYKAASGIADALVRFKLDPTVLAGKAATAARVKYVTQPITKSTDLAAVAETGRFSRFNQALEGLNAAEIRHRFFPDHEQGASISTALATAGNETDRAQALMAMMGDQPAYERLQQSRADLAGQVGRLTTQQSVLRNLDARGFVVDNAPDRVQQLTAEVNTLLPEQDRLERLNKAWGTIREVPRVRALDTLRSQVNRSSVYQTSPFAAPVRLIAGMRPHNLINLHDPQGDVQVSRMLGQTPIPLERQDQIRSAYMAAMTPGERSTVLTGAEDEAVRSIAEHAGMTKEDIDSVLANAAKERGRAQTVLQGRVYDANSGRSTVTVEDEHGNLQNINLPLFVTQEANMLPLVNLDDVKQAATKWGRWKFDHPSTAIPAEGMNTFYKLWKPATLLRVGWPIRVIGDEQLRIFAKVGALSHLKNLVVGAGNVVGNELDRSQFVLERNAAVNAAADKAAQAAGKRGMGADRAAATEELAAAKDMTFEKTRIGQGTVNVGGYQMQDMFGPKGEAPNIYHHLTSSGASFAHAFGGLEGQNLNELRKATGNWSTIDPVLHADSYAPAWERAVNAQIGQDAMGRMLLEDQPTGDIVKWMRNTPEGRLYARRQPFRARNLERWVETAREHVQSYTLGNDEIKQLALKRRATGKDLARIAPDPSTRPMVHGELLDDVLGKSQFSRIYNKTLTTAYKALGSIPSDTLSRHPFAAHMYRAEVDRLVGLMDKQAVAGLDEQTLRDIEGKAREYARNETRNLLYDLAEESNFAHLMRFFLPFYNAWQEVLTRWAGLAVENPQFAARALLAWQAPEKAGIVTDENGNPIPWDARSGDQTTDAAGNPVTLGTQRYVQMTVPKFAANVMRNVPGFRSAFDKNHPMTVRFNKRSFNLAMQGAPGAGPTVQIPVNMLVKDRPQLADSLKFILPYGTTQSTMSLLLPTGAKRIEAQMAGEQDRTYLTTLNRILLDMQVDQDRGLLPKDWSDQQKYTEAVRRTKAFFNLRSVASYISPAAPGFLSPYQPQIDLYRRLKAADPQTADEKFLQQAGPEYFALTQSLTKSLDGIPATTQALGAKQRYSDLIAKYPDLGGLIVGSDGAGTFNRNVYEMQRVTPVAPGSPDKERQALSPQDVMHAPDVRLGWIEYSKAMDLIEAARVQRGLPNLQVKAASDLALLKRAITAKLAGQYPAWFEQFGKDDQNAMARRLTAFRDITADPRLTQRQDIQGLSQYLQARTLIRAVLARRQSHGLQAASNQDVSMLWGAITGKLVERNLAFSDLYYRYLEHDDLTAA